MPDENSARHKLPFLAVGQAQKEITHNESLLIIDALLHPIVEAELGAPPTISNGTQAGKCWLVSSTPSALWQGRAGHIAYWTGSGWRYFAPSEGMKVRNKAVFAELIRTASSWIAPTPIANPAGGTVIDIEARAILASLLSQLRTAGVIGQ